MEKLLKYLPLSCFLLGILFSIVVDGCYHSHFEPKIEPEIQRDTICQVDTFVCEIGYPVSQITREYVEVPVIDTLKIRDTVYIQLPIEEKTYQDSSYKAVVSGYRPNLDYLEIYPTTTTITNTVTNTVKLKPKYSISVTAGYGATTSGLSPFVGVGLSYNILSFGYK